MLKDKKQRQAKGEKERNGIPRERLYVGEFEREWGFGCGREGVYVWRWVRNGSVG